MNNVLGIHLIRDPFALLLLLILPGCSNQVSEVEVNPRPSDDSKLELISTSDRRHDFGPVIGRAGIVKKHGYLLSNQSDKSVKLVRVLNLKTCCGTVKSGSTLLKPGESTSIEVTMLLGNRHGEVVHEVEIDTDLVGEEDSKIILRTSAYVYAPFRVERISGAERPILTIGGEPQFSECRLVSTGTESEPPLDLDRVTLSSAIPVEWIDGKAVLPSDEGILIEGRRFRLRFGSDGSTGARNEDIVLKKDENVLFKYAFEWEVEESVTASPKMVVLKADQLSQKVVLVARDRREFSINRIECDSPSFTAVAELCKNGLSQVVEIKRGVSGSNEVRSSVTVSTNHPSMKKIVIPCLDLN